MADNQIFIPETPAELTGTWLASALAGFNSPAPIIDHVAQEVLGEGEGFMGDLLRLTPVYSQGGENYPVTLIAKLPKLANRTMGELLGAYERENMFYMTMANELPVATPALYYAELDRDAGSEQQLKILQTIDKWPGWTHGMVGKLGTWVASKKQRRYILLIEDITDAAPGNQIAGADEIKACLIVEELARMHAAYWRSETLAEHFWLLPLDVDGRMKFAMSKKSLPAFTQTFGDVLAAGLQSHVDRVMSSYIDDLHALCAAPATLLHGDMRLDNVFFRQPKSEGQTESQTKEVVFFDWQLVRRGPAAYDLAYLLSGCLTPEFGSADGLLDHYHAALVEHGVQDYSRADLGRDYELGLRVVMGSLVTVDQINLGDDQGITMMRMWIERLLGRLSVL